MSTFNPVSFGEFGPDGDVDMRHNNQPTAIDRWNACVYAIQTDNASGKTKEDAIQYLCDLKASHDALMHEMKTCDRSLKSESWYAALKAAEALR